MRPALYAGKYHGGSTLRVALKVLGYPGGVQAISQPVCLRGIVELTVAEYENRNQIP